MATVLGANSVTGGYDVENSLRFNSGSSEYLLRTHGTNHTAVKFAISFWIKRSDVGNEQVALTSYADGNNTGVIRFNANNTLEIFDYQSSYKLRKITNRVFRDISAWYHIVVSVDTAQSTASNRFKLYVNGVQETSFSTNTNYSEDDANMFNKNVLNWIGANPYNSGIGYTNGYMSEFVFIDGTANDEEDFGEFDSDSGIWKPIKVSGLTFGDNGYYLEFKQSGTSQNSSGLGADTSGEDNHFAVASLTAVDQSTDTCTNNFCTPNSLYPQSGGGIAFSEGNLKTVYTSYTQSPNGTIGAGAGKWYYEVKMGGTHARFGWCESHCPQGDLDSSSTFPAYAVYSNGSNGLRVYKNVTNRSYSDNSGYTSFSSGKTLGIAFDIDNGKLYAHLNGTYYNSGDPAGGSGALITGITAQEGGLFLPYLNCGTNSSRTFEFNFGSPPHAISSSNADGDGYGNFEYAVPSGFFSINTKNLAEYG